MQWMKKWGPGQRLGWLLVFLSIAGLSTGAQLVNNDSAVAGAARTADLETVRELIDEGADVNVAQADGTTALLWAAYQSDAEMVRTLIEAGAELDARELLRSDAVASGEPHGRCSRDRVTDRGRGRRHAGAS